MGKMEERESRIAAAGVVQAVIASGARPEQWASLTLYGLRMVHFGAARLRGEKAPAPPVPNTLKENDHVKR